jgi:hypothetical protein
LTAAIATGNVRPERAAPHPTRVIGTRMFVAIESARKRPLMQAPTTRPLTTFDPETRAMTRVTLQMRELAARETDDIHVLLLWHPGQDTVTVSVDDERGGQRFDLAVARNHALEAFHHPFAYAAATSDAAL